MPQPAETNLLAALLFEQKQLTAIDQFVQEQTKLSGDEKFYRDLIPAALNAGHQYAFEVDLDRCSGCKACVTACHALNGLDDGEAWREVGLLVSNDWRQPFQQIVTTACHHCIDPACLNGCPVLAYEKDPMTGVVRHLDDQCIGCQYCILKCPYEVPQYSEARGIVRKCDLCSQRLAAQEAPACAQACPNHAIRITSVVPEELIRAYRGPMQNAAPRFPFLPTAPDPSITIPGTRFISGRPLSDALIPSDAGKRCLQPAHGPLVVMLVLTQLGIGGFVLLPLLSPTARLPMALFSLAATWVGLFASVLHLGRPAKAWRAFLGFRKSWLSREIIGFGVFASLAALITLRLASQGLASIALELTTMWFTAAIGLAALYCSAMVYHDTGRVFWRGIRSLARFGATSALLGLSAAWLVEVVFGTAAAWIPGVLALVAVVKFSGEHRLLRHADDPVADEAWAPRGAFDRWSLAQSALLMRDELGFATRSRFACLLLGAIGLPIASFIPALNHPFAALAALVLGLTGELIERYLFFRAVVPPRMPGGA